MGVNVRKNYGSRKKHWPATDGRIPGNAALCIVYAYALLSFDRVAR